MKLRFAAALFMSGMFCNVIHAQNQSPTFNAFSVQQCIDYARKNNVQIKNSLIDLKQQIETNRGITAMALPTVSGSGNYTDYFQTPITLIPGEFVGQPGTKIPVSFYTKFNSTAGVQLQQTLFDGQKYSCKYLQSVLPACG
jgi:hypothetical protein